MSRATIDPKVIEKAKRGIKLEFAKLDQIIERETKKEYAVPIGDRVLVKVKQKEIKTPSGLLVAQTNPVLPIEGVVVAIGDDRKIECRVGDRVCFGKFAGVEVRLNGEDHIVLAADEVLGILE